MRRPGKFFLALPLLAAAFWPAANVARADDIDVSGSLSLNFGSDDDWDVNEVVFRDYFGCSDYECSFVPYYREYYGLSDDDLMFLFFVARQSHRPVDEVIVMYYYDCGLDDNCLISDLSLDTSVFFIEMPSSFSIEFGSPFYGPYHAWWNHRHHGYRFSRTEFRALISLRIGVEFGGWSPDFVIRSSWASSPHRFFREHRDRIGTDGRNWRGERITVTSPRPWTMSDRERRVMHDQRRERAERHQTEFVKKHDDRVREIQRNPEKRTERPAPRSEPDRTRRPGTSDHPKQGPDRNAPEPQRRVDPRQPRNEPDRTAPEPEKPRTEPRRPRNEPDRTAPEPRRTAPAPRRTVNEPEKTQPEPQTPKVVPKRPDTEQPNAEERKRQERPEKTPPPRRQRQRQPHH